VFEEVGLSLDSPNYAYLGQLDDRFTAPLRGTSLHVSSFAFLQLNPLEISPSLSAKEVADCRFVPLDYFTNFRPQKVAFRLFNLQGSSFDSSWLGRKMGDATYYFPGILLPPFPSEDQITALNSTTKEPAVDVSPLSSADDISPVYVLWGLTLEVCDDAFAMLGFTQRNSLATQRNTMLSSVVSSNPIALLIWNILTLSPQKFQLLKVGVVSLGAIVLFAAVYVPYHFISKPKL